MSSDYKISRFTLVEPLAERDQIALFNTLTQGVGFLPSRIWEEIQTGSVSHESTVNHLLDQGFLVTNDIDEDLTFAHWRNQRAYDLTHLHYLVSPTYGCDLKCSQCYFGETEKIRQMSHETARAVLDFITTDLEQKRPVSVHLDFGQPDTPLNLEVIRYLAEGLHRFCHGGRILFRISITSNGIDIEPNLIAGLKPFGLNKIRIKIGGPGLIHDQLRPTKDGHPTFEKIMHNLENIAGLTEIHLINHYDPTQEDHLLFPTFLNDLLIRGLKEYITSVKFYPVFLNQKRTAFRQEQVGWPDCLANMDPARYFWLDSQIVTWGFFGPKEPPSSHCLANRRDTMVIDVDGNIKACPFQIGSPDLNYGHVKTGIDFYRESRWLAKELPEKCQRSCAIAPICNGGCSYLGFLTTRSNGIRCMYESFERLLRDYMRRMVRCYKVEQAPWITQYPDLSTASGN
ncbi:MAG: SPASM domain-containing protein [Deltaproteobacteria bacterium]|nr:SPASM domain-containing protein [Deltaproteobacteria bacterium]